MIEKYQAVSIRIMFLLLSALSLSACGGALDNQSQDGDVNGVSSATLIPSTNIPIDSTFPVDGLPDTSGNSQDARPELGFALGDPNLKATNPDTVVLASGQIQLIEFFAFW